MPIVRSLLTEVEEIKFRSRLHEGQSAVDRYLKYIRDAQKEKKSSMQTVSVIIPIYNESQSIPELLARLNRALSDRYEYELLFVDDRSTDGSVSLLHRFARLMPIRLLIKNGRKGKSYSLLEGLENASGDVVAIIDGDLQYPPEDIPAMIERLSEADIVVANREVVHTSRLRFILSRIFQLFFGRLLLGIDADVQSGLKVFNAHVLAILPFPVTIWGFDYQFLFKAKRYGFLIAEHPIVFEARKYGESKVNAFLTALELAWGAVKLRFSYIPQDIVPFFFSHKEAYSKRVFSLEEDFLFLPEKQSVKHHVHRETVSLLIATVMAFTLGIVFVRFATGISVFVILSGLGAALYLALMIFKIRVVLAAVSRAPLRFARKEIRSIRDIDLPIYTILIPLYQEAEVIPQIIKAMSAIDYPVDKLDILITLEEYDEETIQAIQAAEMPAHFRTLIIPDVRPKTKPKALNVAFLYARGDFLVIYDAEIIPDPDQLKKAYLGFQEHPEIACLQTRLDHYNARQNWITKLFNAEFSFHYDLFLPGLQKKGYVIPLSGHSTHFRTSVLDDIGAWDPYNLTEDCDMGVRIFRGKYRTDILDSYSREEATSSLHAWMLQRSRWMKGFMQTSLVHLRNPIALKNDLGGWRQFFGFLVLVPGSVVMNVLNLFYWSLFLIWLIAQPAFIQSLFPAAVLYISFFSFAVGNFVFLYLNLLGSYQRKRHSFIHYNLLSFLYWLLLSMSAVRAFVHLMSRPHQWEKTKHGTHLFQPSYAPEITNI